MDDVARRVSDAKVAHIEYRDPPELAKEQMGCLVDDHSGKRHECDQKAGDDDHGFTLG
jgi:hypothetical protein